MSKSNKLAAGIMTALLISASYVPASANPPDSAAKQQTNNSIVAGEPCEPLSWEVANKLPSFIKPGEVICMGIMEEDRQASIRARALLVKAAAQMQDEQALSNSPANIQCDDGIAAYADGRYTEAIYYFQAAMH
jgi:hypothetical protein